MLPGVPDSGCLVAGVLASTASALALAGVEMTLRTLLRSDRTAADLQQGEPTLVAPGGCTLEELKGQA